jgi:hypothetical protein
MKRLSQQLSVLFFSGELGAGVLVEKRTQLAGWSMRMN